jgi:hypothetical protein
MPLKSPASGGQTKFWSKVLVPVLASDDTILEIFDFNNLNFSVFFEATKLLSLGQKSHTRETKNLLTDAPSSTAAKKLLTFFFLHLHVAVAAGAKGFFFFWFFLPPPSLPPPPPKFFYPPPPPPCSRRRRQGALRQKKKKLAKKIWQKKN